MIPARSAPVQRSLQPLIQPTPMHINMVRVSRGIGVPTLNKAKAIIATAYVTNDGKESISSAARAFSADYSEMKF